MVVLRRREERLLVFADDGMMNTKCLVVYCRFLLDIFFALACPFFAFFPGRRNLIFYAHHERNHRGGDFCDVVVVVVVVIDFEKKEYFF